MTDRPPPHDIREVWQNQKVEVVRMSTQELQSRATRFQRMIGRRNLREYVGGVFAIGLYGYFLFHFDDIAIPAGLAMLIAGVLYVVYQLRRRASSTAMPPEMAWQSCADFHRRELERQRDFLRDIWRWGLLPLVPGMVVFLTAASFHDPADWPVLAGTAAVCGLVFFGIAKLNSWAANKLQRQIDELEALG